jgi:uncharacterized protein (DUF1697 family)
VPEIGGSRGGVTRGASCRGAAGQNGGMATHVALLRGINVGRNNRIAMSELRAATEELGYDGVSTYIQSGNVLFSTAQTDTTEIARAIGAKIHSAFCLDIDVVVLSRRELAQAVRDSPFPPEHKLVHVIFLAAEADPALRERIAELEAAKGADRDKITAIGRVMFFYTPGGYGNSELAKALTKLPGTARNWGTTTKLLELIGS